MSCSNPMIMKCIESSYFLEGDKQRLEKQGWKFNKDHTRGYRLVSRDSRSLPLEDIESWRILDDMELPCGHCIQCRLDYSKSWATRCYFESLQYKHNYFVTLTYDDEYLTYGNMGNATIVKEHVTQFIKVLRERFRRLGHVGIRYFGCQEYGDESLRPHAHIILFNCPLNDLTINFVDKEGQVSRHKSRYGYMFYSPLINELWNKGFITVEDANFNTEAYVSRYIMKKQKGKGGKELYEDKLGIVPPYLFMSLKPAIGSHYFEYNQNWLIDNPSVIVPRGDKEPLISGLPQFYKRKILNYFPERYDEMIEKAKINTLKSRSLLKGKKRINDQRADEEHHVISAFEAFGRNAI